MSSDLLQWWGDDLSLTPSGDLALVNGLLKSNQRVFRRLCTNGSQTGAQVGEYIWEPPYGGSLPWYVGQLARNTVLDGLIRAQMYQEASVAHSPGPKVTVNMNPNGTFLAEIQYTEVESGNRTQVLQVDVTGP